MAAPNFLPHDVMVQAVALWKATGKLPSERSGCCGLCGDRVDTLDLIRDEMLGLQDRIREARSKALSENSTPSW